MNYYNPYLNYPYSNTGMQQFNTPINSFTPQVPMAQHMEAKEMHKDKSSQMIELEKYINELGDDLAEMIHDASPEEKALLQQKISTLASKIK